MLRTPRALRRQLENPKTKRPEKAKRHQHFGARATKKNISPHSYRDMGNCWCTIPNPERSRLSRTVRNLGIPGFLPLYRNFGNYNLCVFDTPTVDTSCSIMPPWWWDVLTSLVKDSVSNQTAAPSQIGHEMAHLLGKGQSYIDLLQRWGRWQEGSPEMC